MRWMGILLSVVMFGMVPGADGAEQQASGLDPGERYLTGPQGPYRGLVLDDATGLPLARALVLAVWKRQEAQDPGQRHLVAIRETETDAQGQFVLDGASVEVPPPPLLLVPRLVIYARGYTPYPEEPRFPLGAPATPFRGAGQVVRLLPARGEEPRTMAANIFFATLSGLLGYFGLLDAKSLPPGHPPLELLNQMTLAELEYFGIKGPDSTPRTGSAQPK
jgi:hypothetical protein